VAYEGDRIEGVLPLFKINSRLVGSSISSLPGGICSENPSAARMLLQIAKEIAIDGGAACLTIRDSLFAWESDQEWRDSCSMTIRDLSADWQVLHGQLKRQVKQHLQKSQQYGVITSVSPDYLAEFYNIFSESLRDKGIPVFGWDFLNVIAESLGGFYTIAIATLHKRVIGAIFLIKLGDRLFALWGGAPIRFRPVRTNHALWWACMKFGIEQGCRYLNMGRSLKGSGLEIFKERWGGISQPVYRYHYFIDGKGIYDPLSGQGGNFQYRFFTRVWRHLPINFTRYLGPYLRRHIPFG
jgi:hypothetical protein